MGYNPETQKVLIDASVTENKTNKKRSFKLLFDVSRLDLEDVFMDAARTWRINWQGSGIRDDISKYDADATIELDAGAYKSGADKSRDKVIRTMDGLSREEQLKKLEELNARYGKKAPDKTPEEVKAQK